MKTDYPRISVIVPAFNSSQWLPDCLEALLAQNFDKQTYEILVVDNGSSDETLEIIRQFPAVRLLQEQQRGSYAARNRGVAASSGAILAFTDSDCVPEPDWLRCIDEAMKNTQLDIILGQRVLESGSAVLGLWSDYECAKQQFVFGGNQQELYYGHTNNMAVRRSVYNQCGPFKMLLRGSDTIFVCAVVNTRGCQSVVYLPAMRVHHKEMTGLWSFLKNQFIYGRSSSFYGRMVNTRPLSTRQRWKVLKNTLKSHHYSVSQTVKLLGLLIAGVLVWVMGRSAGWFGVGVSKRAAEDQL